VAIHLHALTTVVVAIATVVGAQVPNAPAPRLVNARSLTCAFTVVATGTWRDGVAESTAKPAKLNVAFASVDTDEGTADAVGAAGKSHITVRVIGNYLNLMQMDPYGALYVTTVFNTETKNGRLLAVHSRHEYTPVQLPGLTSRPEQYYGDCDVRGPK
jgi:hypothetical protein